MKIDWILSPASQFAQSASVWNELNRQCGDLPFLDSLFIQPLLDVFGNDDLRLALGRAGDRCVAAAIVGRAGLGRWESFQPSQLPLGPLLIAPGTDLERVAESLLGRLPGIPLGLGLTQLDPRLIARPADSARFRTLDYIETAWVDLAGDFETYWNARGKNLRQNMRKQRNKLDADGIVPRLEIIRDGAAVAAAIGDYGRLETASWKSEEGTAVSPDNDQGRFYARMLENFCRAGRGVIYRYHLGATVAAMDLCIESGPLLVILKTAYDGSNRALSPAFLMREEQFAGLFAEGRIRRIEFYGKLMEWHTRWTAEARTLYHANAYRAAAVPRLLQLRAGLRREPAATAPAAAEDKT